jgi:hypothetical protein
MTNVRIGYARCSTNKQNLAAQRAALVTLGVTEERIYTDHGMTGTTPARPGPDQARPFGPRRAGVLDQRLGFRRQRPLRRSRIAIWAKI